MGSEKKFKGLYRDSTAGEWLSEPTTNQQVIRSMWIRFCLLMIGAVISLPWLQDLIPRLPGLFSMWVSGTEQQSPVMAMSLAQIILVAAVLLDAIIPLLCLLGVFIQGFKFLRDHDSLKLTLMAHMLWIKSVSPALVGIVVLFIASSGGARQQPDILEILRNPQMGFWLYSPLIAVLALIFARREKRLKREQQAKELRGLSGY